MPPDAELFVKWFEVAFLVIFGAFLWWKGGYALSASSLLLCARRPRREEERLRAAVERRNAIEALPNVGAVYGIAGIVLAILTATNAVSPGLSYALFVLVFTSTVAWIFTHIQRPATMPRAAALTPRRPLPVPIWHYGVAILAIMCLFAGPGGHLGAGDTIVAMSTLAMLAFALLLGKLPALLTGEDASAEVYVDDRLRTLRVLTMLDYICAASFVYITWEYASLHTTMAAIARLVVMLAFFASLFASIVRARRGGEVMNAG